MKSVIAKHADFIALRLDPCRRKDVPDVVPACASVRRHDQSLSGSEREMTKLTARTRIQTDPLPDVGAGGGFGGDSGNDKKERRRMKALFMFVGFIATWAALSTWYGYVLSIVWGWFVSPTLALRG